jgi:hypothetical protein
MKNAKEEQKLDRHIKRERTKEKRKKERKKESCISDFFDWVSNYKVLKDDPDSWN